MCISQKWIYTSPGTTCPHPFSHTLLQPCGTMMLRVSSNTFNICLLVLPRIILLATLFLCSWLCGSWCNSSTILSKHHYIPLVEAALVLSALASQQRSTAPTDHSTEMQTIWSLHRYTESQLKFKFSILQSEKHSHQRSTFPSFL